MDANELKPLFVWKRLTGKVLYELIKFGPSWQEAEPDIQKFWEGKARTLNAQLFLCWRCGERKPLTQPHLICEPCQKKGRVLTQEEYARVLNEEDCDFCSCCGDKTQIAGLQEAQMPDLDNPETIRDLEHPETRVAVYPLTGGFHVCYPCAEHCEGGPCEPDNLVTIVGDTD